VYEDVAETVQALQSAPETGVVIPGTAQQLRKIRGRNRDVRGGKRGGYRLIDSWVSEREEIYLLLAYAKAQKADLTKGEIEALLQVLGDALAAERTKDEPPSEAANEEALGGIKNHE
jgi:mRNA-degrading endonuclease RelE of RelBE toxin-antitoxin system